MTQTGRAEVVAHFVRQAADVADRQPGQQPGRSLRQHRGGGAQAVAQRACARLPPRRGTGLVRRATYAEDRHGEIRAGRRGE